MDGQQGGILGAPEITWKGLWAYSFIWGGFRDLIRLSKAPRLLKG